MAKCAYCDGDLEYLPFSCSFCGNKYCKKHRLPENHDCSFEFQDDRYLVKNASTASDEGIDINYEPPKQEDDSYQNFRFNKNYDRPSRETRAFTPFSNAPKLRATYGIMIINIIFFVAVVVLEIIDTMVLGGWEEVLDANAFIAFKANYTYLTEFLTLNAADFTLQNLRFYTIFTAMFIPGDIISLIFNMLILYSVGKLIEGRFGSKVFIQIYIISGLITGAMVILCQVLFSLISFYPNLFEFGFTTTSGAILGLITFMMFLLPRGEIFLFFFKVKTKNLIWIFVGFYLVIGVISQLFYQPIIDDLPNFPSFILYYASVFGVLGGYLTVRKFMRPQPAQYV